MHTYTHTVHACEMLSATISNIALMSRFSTLHTYIHTYTVTQINTYIYIYIYTRIPAQHSAQQSQTPP